jgi:hypothetical protein
MMLGGRPAQVGNVKIRIVDALDVGPVPAGMLLSFLFFFFFFYVFSFLFVLFCACSVSLMTGLADAQGFQCEVAVQEHKSTTSVMRPPLTWNQELGMCAASEPPPQ